MLLPPLFAASRRRAALIALAGAIGVALSGASLLIAGWDRLVSPLTYQADRGLQVESVSATPAMIAWWLHPHRWHVVYAVHRAYEVTGPGVGALLFASAVLTALYAVGLLVGWWRVLTSPVPVNLEAVVWLSLASVTGFIVTGKVLSPQYLLWLLPAAAAGLVVCGWSRRLRAWCVVLLAAAGATQLVFPTYYLSVILPQPHTWLTIQILAGRNLLLVGLLVAAVLEFRRTLGVSEPPPASLGDADDAVVAGVGVDAPLGYRGPVLDEPVRRQDR
jgi:hypothetical protein